MQKKFIGIVLLGLMIVGGWFYFHSKPTATSVQSPGPAENSSSTNPEIAGNPAANVPAISNSAAAAMAPSNPPAIPATRAAQAAPAASAVADLPPEIVLRNIRHAVRQYGEMFGGDPVGTNPEITHQLSGDNPRHMNFLDPSAGIHVNANGELVDQWNTPYFFHQISGSEMEIHSAGPDRIMWTQDDLVAK